MEHEIKRLQKKIESLEAMVSWRDEQLNKIAYTNMNNSQALGYMLLACHKTGLPKDVAYKVYGEMYYMFDMKTEEEAEEQGLRCYPDDDDDE